MAIVFRRGRSGGAYAFLLAKSSPAPNHPAASPKRRPVRAPTRCAHARAREQQRDQEIALLRSELQEHPTDAEGWPKRERLRQR